MISQIKLPKMSEQDACF